MDLINKSTMQKLKDNLEGQLSELEILQSMFPNPGELRIEDINALTEIKEFTEGNSNIVPAYLDLTINLIVDELKFEMCINLSHDYPDVEPDIFVRNHKQTRTQHSKMNKDLLEYINGLERGEPCIYSAVLWVQDNANQYIEREEDEMQPIEKNDELIRLWVYSHHIYSKTKRREILTLANTLGITGFCMPGKPGIICVEGTSADCNEWWQAIKSMNWKRIFCKVTEECKDEETFLKFNTFEEIAFQSNGNRCNHMDIGELNKYLESHNCSYIFKELFGVESKNSTS